METAKLFRNGRSQAVRLPKEFAFAGKEVFIKKISGVVVLIPKSDPWRPFLESLERFSGDFMGSGRYQGAFEKRRRMK
ncbi:MAG: type II toxin-antitoxin system VapB family antitoxin [Acidobacteriia bacterium]|nr:type II toxin-antitoxin system VapB family antitoxin [Terriglobia bacterium]